MHHSFLRSQAYAFCTVLLWASTYVFTKIVLESFSVSAVAFLRCLTASLFLAAALAVTRTGIPPLRAAVPQFLLVGLVGFALYLPVFNKGSLALNPTTSCIVMATTPIVTALLARLLFKEMLNVRQWLAITLAFGGILVMTLWNGTLVVTLGIVWMLLASFLLSAHNILQRGLTPRHGSLRVTAYGFFVGALLLLPLSPEAAAQAQAAPMTQTVLVCFLGVFPGAVAYLLWARAITLAEKTSSVTNYMFLTPFLTLLLDYAVTGNLPAAETFAGGGIILASLTLFAMAREKPATLPAIPQKTRSRQPGSAL
ncbi:Integral membrane protein DUF6 [uncultured delta proteobacterium]|uniref:Integral membrane protein DUF6 n=1 Tax=uncultured delta proteobacterium TaxID=34034 RepID=A0A212KD02_9DELT|nr:Integral membrane protein DUF6 [uncultured delta proteobacterium]